MLDVAALTSGRNVPSTRFRVRQHIDPLRDAGIAVREFAPRIDKYAPMPLLPSGVSPKRVLPAFALWQATKLATRLPGLLGGARAAAIWLERQILPGYRTLEPLLGRRSRPVVFDVDDAIWLAKPFGATSVADTARRATVVVAGNAYLADWLGQHARDVRVIPTAVDAERFRPKTVANDRFVVGWTGTAGNLPYLTAIEKPLSAFLERHDDAELCVVADRAPTFATIAPERVRFVRWTPEVEAEAVRGFDVGLMPLPDDDWTRGKCSFKMLQYMASGLPVIVSPVGMNADVLSLGEVGIGATGCDDWFDALSMLHAHPARCVRFGNNGREIVDLWFRREVVARQIARVFQEVG